MKPVTTKSTITKSVPLSARSFFLVLLWFVLAGVALLAGCQRLPGQYKLGIEQGNIVDQDRLQQVKTGMSQEQVQFLLGNPVLLNRLNPLEWIYYYTRKDVMNRIVQRDYVVLQFNVDRILLRKSIKQQNTPTVIDSEHAFPLHLAD